MSAGILTADERDGSADDEFDIAAEPANDEPELDIDVSEIEALVADLKHATAEARHDILDEIIEKLPEATDYAFIYGLTRVIEGTADDGDLYADVVERFRSILTAPPASIDRDPTFVRFAGFHALTIHAYQTQGISEWGRRHEEYGHHFIGWESEPIYQFDRSMYQYKTNDGEKIGEARERLRRLSKDALRKNPGVLNAYVSCTLTACEKTDLTPSKALIRDAADTMKRAIALYPYPEYYRNWGRLLATYGELTNEPAFIEKGAEKIQRGMDLERASNTEKLAEYRYYLNDVQHRKRVVEAESKIDAIRDDLETIDDRANEVAQEIRSETLQFLGFFAAIITFVISSVQFSTGLDSVGQIVAVVPVMTGCLVFAFSVLVFLFDEDPLESKRSLLAVWGVGAFLVALGASFYVFLA